jgi:small redox-active disulfide protein 2
MKTVEVLGPGCTNCRQLAANTEAAVRELGLECKIEKITDINVITGYHVLLTPALAVDGVVKASGRVLTVEQIKKILGES